MYGLKPEIRSQLSELKWMLEDPHGGWSEVHCLYPNQEAYMKAGSIPYFNIDEYFWVLKGGEYPELLGDQQTTNIFTISNTNNFYYIEAEQHCAEGGWSETTIKNLYFCRGYMYGNYTFIVYPNPAQNKFYIDVSTGDRGMQGGGYQPDDDLLFTVRLYDWDSYLVLTDLFYKSEAPHAVDVSHLEKGKYILHILYENYLLHSRQVVLN